MSMDDYLDTEDAQPETDDDDPSTTYIQFNSRDHTTAYNLVSDGGAIRSTFSGQGGPNVHDFFAGLVTALGPRFTDGDKTAMLEFIDPSPEEVREYLEQKENDDE